MCILFTYVNNSATEKQYQVIIANNRDEYYIRPTRPADRWTDNPSCISGLDQEPGREGGTWLGLTETGKIAVLLNILQSEEPSKDKKGRGSLVTNFLREKNSAQDYTAPLATDRHLYNPFHLLLLEKRFKKWSVHYFGSHDNSSPCGLGEEISGWGNSHRDRPWNKVKEGRKKFTEVVNQHHLVTDRDILVENLLELLNNRQQHFPDPVLQETAAGYLPDLVTRERSSIHVQSRSIMYGTRTNTLLLIDSTGRGEYIERTLREPIDPEHTIWDTKCIPFTVQDLS